MTNTRYKFDEVWRDALSFLPSESAAVLECAIREYQSGDVVPSESDLDAAAYGMFILIKNRIDERKKRNARARDRRRSMSPLKKVRKVSTRSKASGAENRSRRSKSVRSEKSLLRKEQTAARLLEELVAKIAAGDAGANGSVDSAAPANSGAVADPVQDSVSTDAVESDVMPAAPAWEPPMSRAERRAMDRERRKAGASLRWRPGLPNA